jgi:hypothetical protein
VATLRAIYEDTSLTHAERRFLLNAHPTSQPTPLDSPVAIRAAENGGKREHEEGIDEETTTPAAKRPKLSQPFDDYLDEWATIVLPSPLGAQPPSTRYRTLKVEWRDAKADVPDSPTVTIGRYSIPTAILTALGWRLSSELGAGGHGSVYLLNDAHAVKIGEVFEKEYSTARILGDFDIGPRVYQYVMIEFYGTERATEPTHQIGCMVMERMEVTFWTWTRPARRPFTHPKQLTAYDAIRFDQLVERMLWHGLIHRDFHTENIMVRSVDASDPWQIDQFRVVDSGHASIVGPDMNDDDRKKWLATFDHSFDQNFSAHFKTEFPTWFPDYEVALRVLYGKHRGQMNRTRSLIYNDEDWRPVLSQEDHDDVIRIIVAQYPNGPTVSIRNSLAT